MNIESADVLRGGVTLNWRDALVGPVSPTKKAIEIIEKGGIQIAFVCDDDRLLLGTVTDGDIRRGILRGISLDDPVERIMRKMPVTAFPHEDRQEILARMRQKQVRQIPLVDEEGRLQGVEILDELLTNQNRPNFVVLMAGGLGTRLRPLTDHLPKPLIRVGNKPILETILENFIQYGFKRFFISVNYKDDMLKSYFEDGSRWGVTVEYICEETKMGTAGSLSLLPEKSNYPVIVMNGDLLTKINFQHLLDFHKDHGADATLCVREYDFQVPYGVVKTDHQKVYAIDEKPVHKFFVNAGIYVLNADVLSGIEKNMALDMPQLFAKLMAEKKEVAAFPIREYWLDVGRLDDLERAHGEFAQVFQ